MDRTTEQWTFRVKDEVFGADGGKLGTVTAVHPLYLVVEKGFFFSTDYYIPRSAVANCDNGKITLFVSKNAALDQGWNRRPDDDAGRTIADRYLPEAPGTRPPATGPEVGTPRDVTASSGPPGDLHDVRDVLPGDIAAGSPAGAGRVSIPGLDRDAAGDEAV